MVLTVVQLFEAPVYYLFIYLFSHALTCYSLHLLSNSYLNSLSVFYNKNNNVFN